MKIHTTDTPQIFIHGQVRREARFINGFPWKCSFYETEPSITCDPPVSIFRAGVGANMVDVLCRMHANHTH